MKLTFYSPAALRLKGVQPTLYHRARVTLALALAILILLPSLSLTVSAQTPTGGSKTPDRDYFTVYASPDGDTICRAANALERSELEKINPKNLRQVNHVGDKSVGLNVEANNDLPQHLTIILRATTNLENNAAAKAAFIRAAANWENVVTSPVTIYIDADFGPDNFGSPWPSGVLGSTSAPSGTYSYSTVQQNLLAGANTPDKTALYSAF